MFSEGFNKFLDSAYGESFRQLSLVWDEFSIIRFKIVKGSGKHNGLNMGDVHHMKHLAEKWCVLCMYHDRRLNVIVCKAVNNLIAQLCMFDYQKYLIKRKIIIVDITTT